MPGRADFSSNPSLERLAAACVALARLHEAWVDNSEAMPCPAVKRRMLRWRAWQDLVNSGWRPGTGGFGPCLINLVQRAWPLLERTLPRLPSRLVPWLTRPLPVRTCLCDIWHEHVLFEGAAVTGLIDYGSIRTDHVAVDLARMLGSLAGDDKELFAAGLVSYGDIRKLSEQEVELVYVLDSTGTQLGVANWLMWLCHERRPFEDVDAVARRLAALVNRLETL
jgi:Ser/Thr protein kinase RdoA (MazF antagonist)